MSVVTPTCGSQAHPDPLNARSDVEHGRCTGTSTRARERRRNRDDRELGKERRAASPLTRDTSSLRPSPSRSTGRASVGRPLRLDTSRARTPSRSRGRCPRIVRRRSRSQAGPVAVEARRRSRNPNPCAGRGPARSREAPPRGAPGVEDVNLALGPKRRASGVPSRSRSSTPERPRKTRKAPLPNRTSPLRVRTTSRIWPAATISGSPSPCRSARTSLGEAPRPTRSASRRTHGRSHVVTSATRPGSSESASLPS